MGSWLFFLSQVVAVVAASATNPQLQHGGALNPISRVKSYDINHSGGGSYDSGQQPPPVNRKHSPNYALGPTSSYPSFAGPIENITVNVGREAVLECQVNHLGKYKVGWLKAKDQTILALHHRVITHNGRIDVDHDANRFWKLKIRQVQESDRGCYMCQINTEVMKKQIGCIDVLIPPDIDDDTTSSDVVVNEGEDASLVCKAHGHPTPKIVWLREDKADFAVYDPSHNHSKRLTVKRHHGEMMNLRKVQRSQMGAYLCIASNEVPPAVSKRIMLNVNFAPEIEADTQLIGVGPGTDVTISCNVQAYPSAINYWMKDDIEMLLEGPKYEIREERASRYERIMYLKVKNWQPSDESHFSCISTNSLGKADRRIQAYTHVVDTSADSGIRRGGQAPPTPEYEYVDTTKHKGRNRDSSKKWRKHQREKSRERGGSSSGGGGVRGSDNPFVPSADRNHNDQSQSANGRNRNNEKDFEEDNAFGSSFFVNDANSIKIISTTNIAKFFIPLLLYYSLLHLAIAS